MCGCNKNMSNISNPSSKFEGGGCISCDFNHFDVSELDNYETMLYNDYIKHSTKEEALQLLINSVEGDYSQLSPKLAEIAEKYYGDVEYANGGELKEMIKLAKLQANIDGYDSIVYEDENGLAHTRKSEFERGISPNAKKIALVQSNGEVVKYANGGGVGGKVEEEERLEEERLEIENDLYQEWADENLYKGGFDKAIKIAKEKYPNYKFSQNANYSDEDEIEELFAKYLLDNFGISVDIMSNGTKRFHSSDFFSTIGYANGGGVGFDWNKAMKIANKLKVIKDRLADARTKGDSELVKKLEEAHEYYGSQLDAMDAMRTNKMADGGDVVIWIALSKTKDGLLLSERFNNPITNEELYHYYKNKGYEIIDSNIFKVTNKDVLDVFKDAVSKFIVEKYNEVVDWDNSLLSYDIVDDRIIAQSCFVKTKDGNEYELTPNDLVKSHSNGGRVENIESEINELYSKFNFINDDFNWKLKLLEMLQDRSIEAYNIYQLLSENQKEEVLQELFEADNDMGSYGDGEISTSKENLDILLEDAKNGNKLPYSNGGGVGENEFLEFNYNGTIHKINFVIEDYSENDFTRVKSNKITFDLSYNADKGVIYVYDYEFSETQPIYVKEINKSKYAKGGGVKNRVYIEFLNKKKNFTKDKKYFNSEKEAREWALKNFEKFHPDMIKHEFANGGGIGKAIENLHSKASKGTTSRGKNKFKFPVELYAISVPEYEYKFNGSAIGKYIDTGVNNPNTGKNMVYYVLQIAPKDELIELRPLGYRSGVSTKFEYVKDFGYTELVNDKDKFANGGGFDSMAGGGAIKQNEGKLFNEKGEMLVYKKQSDTSSIYNVDVYEPRKTDVEEYSKFKYCKREKNGRECVYRLDKKALLEMIKKEKFIYSNGGGVGLIPLTHEDFVKLAKEKGYTSKEEAAKAMGYRYNGEMWIDKRNEAYKKPKFDNGGELKLEDIYKIGDNVDTAFSVGKSWVYDDINKAKELLNKQKSLGFESIMTQSEEGGRIKYTILSRGKQRSYEKRIFNNGGGIGEDNLSIPSKTFSKSSEGLVKDNLFDGEISVEKLKSIIGREPNYPTQMVGSIKLTKCFLKPFYKI